jgi:hypothetical protein
MPEERKSNTSEIKRHISSVILGEERKSRSNKYKTSTKAATL